MKHQQPHQNCTPDEPASKFILIGEDDVDDQDFLKEIFSTVDPNFSLVFLNNGRDVVSYLEGLKGNNLPCLLVLDYNMPGLTGAEILMELKADTAYHPIPKIIWSTSGSDTYRLTCIDAGANDYVIKPSNVKELTEVVKYMISFC